MTPPKWRFHVEVSVDRIKKILKSGLTRRIGLVSAALLGAFYTLEYVHPDLPQMSAVDAILARDVAQSTPSAGWDLRTAVTPGLRPGVTFSGTTPRVNPGFRRGPDGRRSP